MILRIETERRVDPLQWPRASDPSPSQGQRISAKKALSRKSRAHTHGTPRTRPRSHLENLALTIGRCTHALGARTCRSPRWVALVHAVDVMHAEAGRLHRRGRAVEIGAMIRARADRGW